MTSSPFMIAVHKVPMDYWRFTRDGLEVLLHDFSEVHTFSKYTPSPGETADQSTTS